jgi:hypothetical protein
MEGGGEFVFPRPGFRYPQTQAAAAAGEAGGDVQQPVAELFRLGAATSPSSSRTRIQASRSIAVGLSSSQAALTLKSREGKRPKPVVLPHRMWSSPVACPQ